MTTDTPAAELRAAEHLLRAAQFRGAMTATPAVAALVRARLALADWLGSWTGVDLSEHGPMPEDAQHAIVVARRILGTTEQADTVAAPAVDRATGLREGDGLRARFEALAADWEQRGKYGDVALTWGARGVRAVLAAEPADRMAAEAQQPTPAGELQLTGFGLAATGQPVHSVAVTSCPDFPVTCPTLTPVPADPPHHYGGIRCGCGDVTTQQPTPAPAEETK